MKKLLSVLLAAILLISLTPAVFADIIGIGSFKINPYGGEEAAIDTVNWYSADRQYFLFLPAETDLTAAKIYFSASAAVKIDGEEIASGSTADAFTPGKHTLTCGGKTYNLQVLCSSALPAVYITTESGSLDYIHRDKENKEPGNIRIYENGGITVDKELKQIKGRGNATWEEAKKPYNIKFDKKTDLFGMGKAKKWTLLANYFDETLLRNVFSWEYAKAFGLYYSSEYQHVDLYINGDYLGNYVICESVEVGSERINIQDLEDLNEEANPDVDEDALPRAGTGKNGAVESGTVPGSAKWVEYPASPADISGGYLMELELYKRYDNEISGFVCDVGQPVVIKSPELATEAEVRYIHAIVNDAFNALHSPTGYNDKGKYYTDYFDMDALVNMYILQELSENLDAGVTSNFFYKAQNSDKLVFSPVWDFDHAYGDGEDRFGSNNGNPDSWWANGLSWPHLLVYNAAYRHEDFRTAVRARWAEINDANLITDVAAQVEAMAAVLAPSARMNIVRWDKSVSSDAAAADTLYQSLVERGSNFLVRRRAALTKGFAEDAAMLYYDANGGSGSVFNPTIASVGEEVTVIGTERGINKITAPNVLYLFKGWNTAPDGSGRTYKEGDRITLNENVTVLYAQWKTPDSEIDPNIDEHLTGFRAFIRQLREFFAKIADFFRRTFGW